MAGFNPAILILAAGKSERFDGIKQLADVGGKSMLVRCLDLCLTLPGAQWILVLGQHADQIKQQIEIPGQVQTLCIDSETCAMSYSIRQALRLVNKDISHVLVVLPDQLDIGSLQLQKLLAKAAQQPSQIVASSYANKLGAPAVFPAVFFDHLEQLNGDQGAGKLINNNKQDCIAVAMPEAQLDIDTKLELQRWLAANQTTGTFDD